MPQIDHTTFLNQVVFFIILFLFFIDYVSFYEIIFLRNRYRNKEHYFFSQLSLLFGCLGFEATKNNSVQKGYKVAKQDEEVFHFKFFYHLF